MPRIGTICSDQTSRRLNRCAISTDRKYTAYFRINLSNADFTGFCRVINMFYNAKLFNTLFRLLRDYEITILFSFAIMIYLSMSFSRIIWLMLQMPAPQCLLSFLKHFPQCFPFHPSSNESNIQYFPLVL